MSGRSDRRSFLGLALLPVAAALAVLLAPPEADTGIDQPLTGYEQIVRDVYAKGGVLTVSHDPRKRVVEVNEEALARHPVLQTYFNRSYLRRDVERNDPRLWHVDGRLIGLASGTHTAPSPFSPGAWHGDVTLASGEIRLMLKVTKGAEQRGAIPLDPGTSVVPKPRPLDVSLDERQSPGRSSSYLRFVRRNETRVLAEMRVVRGHVWVESLSKGVAVDAAELAPGEGRVLENGASLVIEDRGGSATKMVLVRGSGATISKWNGIGVRYRDDRYRELAEAIEAAMDSAVYKCGVDCPFSRQPVELTIDRGIDLSAQTALNSVAAQDRWPAAVTVMDALRGDLLALASHAPAPSTLRRSEWDRVPINYNFQPLAVGSAAKPLVTAAILAHSPQLARLEVRAEATAAEDGRVVEEVLGFRMRPPLGVADGIAPGSWIDLPTYLQYSSNYYAAALMIMGLDGESTAPTPSGGSYRFAGGPPQPFVPPRALATSGDGIFRLDSFPPWKKSLRNLFGIGVRSPRGPADISVWRNLPGGIGRPGNASSQGLLAGFEPLSPLRQDWALDQASGFTLRETYIPVMLGGAAYGWTNIGLAQGFARIVTGRQVTARFVAASGDRPARSGILPREPRQAICEGLARVAERGTAAREATLVRALADLRSSAKGSTIGFFSKTGTPEIDRLSPLRQRLTDLEDQLLADGRIQFVRGKLTVVDAGGAAVAPMLRSDLRRAADILVNRGAQGVVARRAAARMLAFNTGDTGAYLTSFGTPKRVPRPAADRQEFGHAFVFVVTVHRGIEQDSRNCLQQPTAAYAIAINVQEEADKASALKIAARLLGSGSALRSRILAAAAPVSGAGS
jgi:hypothetical protein